MKRHLPSPALIVAGLALFVALTGGAVAAGIVPLAQRAYSADTAKVALNAKKLGGKTPAQLAAAATGSRGPAGSQGPAGPQGSKGDRGATGSQGPAGQAGPKGDVGAGLKIVGTVATVGDLPATGTTGDAYLVAGDLHVWTGSAWTNAGPVKGPKGDKGDTGAAGAAGPPGPPGAAGAAAVAVSVHTQPFTLAVNTFHQFTTACGAGQKAVSGGFTYTTGSLIPQDSTPTGDGSGWQLSLINISDTEGAAGTLNVVCLG